MALMKTHREMMKRTISSMYELFGTGQIESLAQLLDKDARLDCTAYLDYNPGRGMFFGRSEIREWFSERRAAVEFSSFKWQISEVDEARGTVLVQKTIQGKYRSTGKSFTFPGFDMMSFRNGQIYRMKFWGDDREMAHASKTPACEAAFKLTRAFFEKDMATMQKLMGNAKMTFHGASIDPKVGNWSLAQWMEAMKKYEYQYTARKVIFQSKNHVIIEERCSHWADAETGQSLMGHRPEEFRMYHHLLTDDQGKPRELQMHMSPTPSGFLHCKPNGGANKRGLVQHVQHTTVQKKMRLSIEAQRAR